MFARMVEKLLIVFLLTSVVLATISGCAREEKVYKIGAIFDVTGPASDLGVPEQNTAAMLEEEINAAGGINGNKVQIIVYDTAGDETTARTRLDKLINVDKVSAIVGPTRSGTSLGIIDLVQQKGAEIPNISCAASVKIVEPVEERKWVFKTPQSDVLMGQAIVDHLVSQDITKVAIITERNPFGASGKEQLEVLLPGAGVETVANEEFGDQDPDTSVQLTKIKGTEAQAVICWSTSKGGAVVTRNMKADLQMEIPLIMSHGVANMTYIDLAGEAANGVIFPCGKLLVANELPDSDQQKTVLVKYATDYKAKFNEEPSTFGGHAWDAIYLVVNAMKKVGDDKIKIRDEIENTKNFVGTGGVFNFSPTDHNGLTKQGVVMIKIVDGKWTLFQ
jgi:branched-chain amino acid transport system substrate-binding protein